MKRWLGIIAIIVLIFTACGGDNDEGTNNESNADFSVLYGKWRYTFLGNPFILIITEGEIEHYVGGVLDYKCEIQSVKNDTNTGNGKDEYPEGFLIKSVVTEIGTLDYYVTGDSMTHFIYLNENKDKIKDSITIYTKVVE